MTLTLKAPTEEGSTVLLGVDRDDGAIQDAAKKFVDAYNSLAGTIKSLNRYDVATEAAGALLGDSMLRNIESQVRNARYRKPLLGDRRAWPLVHHDPDLPELADQIASLE